MTGGDQGKRRLNRMELYTAAVSRGGDAGLGRRLPAVALAAGLSDVATDQEIDSILARVYSFVQDPATLVAVPRIVQEWGAA